MPTSPVFFLSQEKLSSSFERDIYKISAQRLDIP